MFGTVCSVGSKGAYGGRSGRGGGMFCGEVLLLLRTFFDSLMQKIFPVTALKFLVVLNDVRRSPLASAGHKQGSEEVEYDADDVLGEGLCRVLVREFQDKQRACSECACHLLHALPPLLPFRHIRVTTRVLLQTWLSLQTGLAK